MKPIFLFCEQNKISPAGLLALEAAGFVPVLIVALTSRRVATLPMVLFPEVK